MKTYPDVGSRIELTNLHSGEAAQGRVLAVRRSKEGVVQGIAVELVVPSETFWGVNFQLKRASAELVKLEQALKSSGIDLHMLKEFRNAVDYIRRSAWAVQEKQERQLRGLHEDTYLSLLVAERISRATQLSTDLTSDLDASQVTHEAKGIAELYRAVERLYQRLSLIFDYREAQHKVARKT